MPSDDLNSVVLDLIARRQSGERIPDRVVLDEHPGDQESLRRELKKLACIERARILATLPTSDLDLDPTLFPSAVVQGYTFLREINRGGQAAVYLAKRLSDDALVAVKLLHPQLLDHESERKRFVREVETLAALNHPAIVQILDHGTTAEGRLFLVMNYIDGQPLRTDELAQHLSIEARLKLFAGICAVLNEAHQRGIVHRDLKPSNIRIDRNGVPHILDFGLAVNLSPEQIRQSLTVTGHFVGTYLWASPEQRRGESSQTPASDIYSLGVILHQLVTGGKFPPQVYEGVESVVENRESRLSKALPAVKDGRLRKIVLRCLQQKPEDRFADAGYLRDAIVMMRPRRSAWPLVLGVTAMLLAATAYVWPSAKKDGWFNRRDYMLNGRPVLDIKGLPELAWIPPGEFLMGSGDEKDGYPDERPQRVVRIEKGFYLAIYELRQWEYLAVMGTNPSRFNHDLNLPVERVSYLDAVEFCRRKSEQTRKKIRLPTEAEWEYACRAGTKTKYSFGEEEVLFQRYGNLGDLSSTEQAPSSRMNYNDRHPYTAVPGSFISNPWGIDDMYGNVWEWCQAPYVVNAEDPTTELSDRASARGGSWWDTYGAARNSNRNPLKVDTKTSTLGFRVVVEDE